MKEEYNQLVEDAPAILAPGYDLICGTCDEVQTEDFEKLYASQFAKCSTCDALDENTSEATWNERKLDISSVLESLSA